VNSGQAYLYPSAQKRVIEHVFHDTGEEYNDSFDLLSEREKEICSLVAKGYTNKETGELLNISPRTVETHKSKIMEKLKLTTRRDLVQFALKRGLLDN
jgi:two-component system response regulator NreC